MRVWKGKGMAQEQKRKKTATGTETATKDSPKSARSKKSQNDVRTVRSNSPSNGLKNEEKDGKITKKTEGVAPKKKSAEPKPFYDPDQERIRIPKAPSESWNVIMPYLLCGAAVLLTLLFMIVFIGRIASGNGDAGTVGLRISCLPHSWLLHSAGGGLRNAERPMEQFGFSSVLFSF